MSFSTIDHEEGSLSFHDFYLSLGNRGSSRARVQILSINEKPCVHSLNSRAFFRALSPALSLTLFDSLQPRMNLLLASKPALGSEGNLYIPFTCAVASPGWILSLGYGDWGARAHRIHSQPHGRYSYVRRKKNPCWRRSTPPLGSVRCEAPNRADVLFHGSRR